MDWLTLLAGGVRIPIRAPYGNPIGIDQRMGVPSHDQLLQKRTSARGHLRGGLAFGVSFVRQTAPHSHPTPCDPIDVNHTQSQPLHPARSFPVSTFQESPYWVKHGWDF
jgi:hypothetical protein